MFIGSKTVAQSTYELGALPAISLNKKLSDGWELNFKTEQRFRFSSGTFDAPSDRQTDYVLSDYSLLVGKKVGLNSKINAGYLIRFREGAVVHRSIQQFTLVRKLSHLRLAHRFTSDQTYSQDVPSTFRFRYRIGTELPLNGQSADTKEWYLKLTNEYLHIFQSADYDLELRLVTMAGYAINKKSKLEFGFDYRLDSFLNAFPEHVLRASINWYYSI
jgi:hypothetical protein